MWRDLMMRLMLKTQTHCTFCSARSVDLLLALLAGGVTPLLRAFHDKLLVGGKGSCGATTSCWKKLHARSYTGCSCLLPVEGNSVWVQGAAVPAIVARLLAGLVPALQSGEEAGTLHARRLTTALQASKFLTVPMSPAPPL